MSYNPFGPVPTPVRHDLGDRIHEIKFEIDDLIWAFPFTSHTEEPSWRELSGRHRPVPGRVQRVELVPVSQRCSVGHHQWAVVEFADLSRQRLSGLLLQLRSVNDDPNLVWRNRALADFQTSKQQHLEGMPEPRPRSRRW